MEVDHVLSLCMSIYHLVGNVKANKERCQRVAKKVKALEELIRTIRQRGLCQLSAPVNNALTETHLTLLSAKALITKFTKTKTVMNVFKSSVNEGNFAKINERLDDNFQLLSGALQIEQGDMLNRMCDTLSRSRKLEDFVSPGPVGSPTSTTTSTPVPMITAASGVTTLAAAMPVPSVIPPMSPCSMIAMPTPSILPAYNPIIPMNFTRSIGLTSFTPTVVSQPYLSTVFIPPKPVIHTVAPMTMQSTQTVTQMYTSNTTPVAFPQTNQSVATSYMMNRPF